MYQWVIQEDEELENTINQQQQQEQQQGRLLENMEFQEQERGHHQGLKPQEQLEGCLVHLLDNLYWLRQLGET